MKKTISQFIDLSINFRKNIVYWANEKIDSLYKEMKSIHPDTLLYATLNVKSAWYKVLSALPDPSGYLNAKYEADRVRKYIQSKFK